MSRRLRERASRARLVGRVGRHPAMLVVVASLGVTAIVLLAQGGARAASGQAAPPRPAALVERGRELFVPGCSGCHGLQGQGLRAPDGAIRGPSLRRAGEAGAYYWVHTGRMPLANSGDIPQRKPSPYSEQDIDALVAYVGTLGSGPRLPRIDLAGGNLAAGGDLYRGICAACHSASGAGGALSYGRAAPSLQQAMPLEVGAAVRFGPGQMPRFGPDVISAPQLNSVARYVEYLRSPQDPGGISLGRIGPVPEGFLIWVFGVGLLLVTVAWIGKRSRPTLAGEVPNEEDG